VARPPEGFRVTGVKSVRIAPHADGMFPITVAVPGDGAPGLHVMVADVGWDDAELREWTEAVLEVVP
jgi:hypothetical protein